jgi:8-amino-7-oxononanoate synthase
MLVEERMRDALAARRSSGLLRALRAPSPDAADFSSNDYLGIARRRCLVPGAHASAGTTGATGSRLLSGHSHAAEALERTAAHFHSAPAALLFNSGYDANVGFFSCVPQRSDVIVYDKLIHASVHDGMRLGRAHGNLRPFAHNSLTSLRDVLVATLASRPPGGGRAGEEQSPRVIFVAVESVYSMDGDVAPLAAMLELASALSTPVASIVLVVDEAHGVGVAGPRGEGVAVAQNVQAHPRLLARMATYGKAFGAHGATVLGSPVLRAYLINYARALIYSTSLPPHSLAVLASAYAYIVSADADAARAALAARRDQFRAAASRQLPRGSLLDAGAHSPIQGVLVPGSRACVTVADALRRGGFDVYPIRAPTVPEGTERIRVILHAHNTRDEVRRLVDALASAIPPGGGGERRAQL